MKVCIIQPDIAWEDPASNLSKYSEMIDRVGKVDLIVLPEMFTTGFSMEPERLKESMRGDSLRWMKMIAGERDCAITGSLIIEEDGNFYNRCLWVLPDGKIEWYDKRHLFTFSGENDHYSSGKKRLIVEYKNWRFCPLICYDLRFPVWSRNTEEYDVLIYMANWPSPRHHVWKNLLFARAIENQAYCIGVNRVGTDGNGLRYDGDSAFVDPKGIVTYLGHNEQTGVFDMSFEKLHRFRNEFPVLGDRDKIILL